MKNFIIRGFRFVLRKIGIKLPNEQLTITIKQGKLVKYTNVGGFQTRAEATLKMILEVLLQNANQQSLNKTMVIHIGDFPLQKENHFAYCTDNKERLNKTIPDFIFGNWPQVGIHNYDKTATQMSTLGSQPYLYSKMLWIGNTNTHLSRKKFLQLSENYSDFIEAYDTAVDKVVLENKRMPYISLQDHTKYKYLIDIEGRGYSARMGLLLFSQRVVFIQERQWKQYYYFDLEPYIHFIPVKNDFSDLIEQIKMVEEKGETYYKQIAQNALLFAQKHLTYQSAVEKMKEIIYHP